MSKIEVEIRDPHILQMGVAALTEFYTTLATAKLELPGLVGLATGVGSPFLNVVIDTRTTQEWGPEQTETLADFFKTHQVPWVLLQTPLGKMHDLEQQGYGLIEEAPSMYFDLSKLQPGLEKSAFKIHEATPRDNLYKWIEPLNEGFPSSDKGEAYRKLNANLLHAGEKKLRHFVAYYEDEAAAAATLFLGREAAMLHNMATKIAYQRRGLGEALALHMMALAKKVGHKHCFLDSSTEGYKLYKRLGFKVYCPTKAFIFKSKL